MKYGNQLAMSKTPILLALLGLAAILAAIGLNEFAWQEEIAPKTAPSAEAPKPETPEAKPSTDTASKPDMLVPSFDVVRINPEGDAVIAGRAAPKSMVSILENGKVIGTVQADERGEWVFIPENPLSAGSRSISLSMKQEDGTVTASTEDVVIVVPEMPEGTTKDAAKKALVLKFPKDGDSPARVLQNPNGPTDRSEFPLTIDTLDYDAKGQVVIGGMAPAGSLIQLYLDKELVSRVYADDKGQWIARPEQHIPPGLYTLRADQIDAGGKVIARVEYPFSRAEDLQTMAEGTFVLVQPGNSLWRIARRLYGSGFSYTQIFQANKERIIDPDLIYPGQVFEIPSVN